MQSAQPLSSALLLVLVVAASSLSLVSAQSGPSSSDHDWPYTNEWRDGYIAPIVLAGILILGSLWSCVCTPPEKFKVPRVNRDEANTILVFSRDDEEVGLAVAMDQEDDDDAPGAQAAAIAAAVVPDVEEGKMPLLSAPGGAVPSYSSASSSSAIVPTADQYARDSKQQGLMARGKFWAPNVSSVSRTRFLHDFLRAQDVRVNNLLQLEGVVIGMINADYAGSSALLCWLNVPLSPLLTWAGAPLWLSIVSCIPLLIYIIASAISGPFDFRSQRLVLFEYRFPLNYPMFYYRGLAAISLIITVSLSFISITSQVCGQKLYFILVAVITAQLAAMVVTMEQVTIRRVHPHALTAARAGLNHSVDQMEHCCTDQTHCSLRASWRSKSPTFLLELAGANISVNYDLNCETLWLAHVYEAPATKSKAKPKPKPQQQL